MNIELIGFIAATFTTLAFIPQALKSWKTKSTGDLSPLMFSSFFFGVILWLVYGIKLNNTPIILANSITLCFASIILYYILRKNKNIHIEHIAIWVENLEEMKEFYCHHFNAKSNKKYHNPKTKFSSYFISFNTGSRIELMHKPGFKSDNNIELTPHISLSLGSKEAVDTFTRRLQNEGIKLIGKPRLTGDGYYESVIEDSEGNLIELTV